MNKMAEDYAELKRRLAEMQAQKGAIQVRQPHDAARRQPEIQDGRPGRILERIGCLVVLAAAVAGAFLWFYHQRQEKMREDRAHEAQEEQARQRILQFAAQYDAVTDWRKSLSSEVVPHIVYGAELTPLFVRQDHRPLLFVVSVKDVTLQDSEYTIHSETRIFFGKPLRLELRATPEQARTVMANSADSIARYAIVARIESVNEFNQSSQNSEGPRTRSVAEGECVGVLPVGRYFGDILEMIPGTPGAPPTK
jgi:hypothetical protein